MFNIRTKLLLAFLGMVLVPLIGTALYGNWITSRVLSERAIGSARDDVTLHAEQIAGSLDRVRGDLLYLAHLDSLQKLVAVDDPSEKADFFNLLEHAVPHQNQPPVRDQIIPGLGSSPLIIHSTVHQFANQLFSDFFYSYGRFPHHQFAF